MLIAVYASLWPTVLWGEFVSVSHSTTLGTPWVPNACLSWVLRTRPQIFLLLQQELYLLSYILALIKNLTSILRGRSLFIVFWLSFCYHGSGSLIQSDGEHPASLCSDSYMFTEKLYCCLASSSKDLFISGGEKNICECR